MPRALKIISLTLAAGFGLLLLCIALLLLFFNPNHYKSELEPWISAQIGRSFTLDGEMGWRVWPNLALTLPHAQWGQAPGFVGAGNAASPFAEWQHASISLRLWPLLQGRLQFGVLELNGLHVSLQRDTQGRDNWRDLLQLLTANTGRSRWQFDGLAGLQLHDVEVRVDDRARSRVTNLQLSTLKADTINVAQPVNLELVARLRTEAGAQMIDMPFKLSAQMQTDASLQQWQMHKLQVTGQFTGAGLIPAAAQIASLPFAVALTELQWRQPTQLQVQSLRVAAGTAKISGAFSASQLDTQPLLDASMQATLPDLRQWLNILGIAVAATRDPQVLRQLQATLRVSGSVDDLRIELPQLQLDQTQWRGAVHIATVNRQPSYNVNLQGDQVDLDRYSPAVVTGRPNVMTTAARTPIPVEWLRSLHVQGSLQMDQARWQGIRAQHWVLKLDEE